MWDTIGGKRLHSRMHNADAISTYRSTDDKCCSSELRMAKKPRYKFTCVCVFV